MAEAWDKDRTAAVADNRRRGKLIRSVDTPLEARTLFEVAKEVRTAAAVVVVGMSAMVGSCRAG